MKPSIPHCFIKNFLLSIFICFLLLLTVFFQNYPNNDRTTISAESSESRMEASEPAYNILDEHMNFRSVEERVISDLDVMYAIIAPENFKNKLIPLVNWKTYKGVPSKIYTLESIYANFTNGSDDAENIHEFLRDLEERSKVLTWLLLVGDADVVPVRKLRAEAGNNELDEYYASDYYYAGLSNDWDKDNDGEYGEGTNTGSYKFEGDWTPDVYVGRLPVGNISELNISVNDIIKYEKTPLLGNWMKNVKLWGGLMNAPNVPEYDSNFTNAYKVKEHMVKPLFEDASDHWDFEELYDYPQLKGNNYDHSLDLMKRSKALAEFDEGCSILNFAGQAYYTGNALLHYDYLDGTKTIHDPEAFSELFYGDDGEAAQNGRKLPLVTSFTCGSGDFAEKGTYDDEGLERLLVAPEGGAIGLVASTGKTHRGEVDYSDGNWWMDKKFYEIFLNETYQPGKCLYKMKQKYYNNVYKMHLTYETIYKAMLFGYNYMGDPELNIWTNLPGNLKINITGLWLGPHNASVTVYDQYDYSIPNARVCIQNDEVYAYGVTNDNGVAKIFINPTQISSVDVVVTAHNFLPYNKSYDLDIEPADLKITNDDIEFSTNNPSVYSSLTINATIKNRGHTDFDSNANVYFAIDAPVSSGGEPIGDPVVISGLDKGDSVKLNKVWEVLPGQHTIYVEIDPHNLVFESDRLNNLASRSIYVRKPEVYVLDKDITFKPEFGVYIGEKIQITAKIYNIGDVKARNFKVKFIDRTDENDDIQIGQLKSLPTIDKNSFGSVSATWTSVGGKHEIIIQIDPDNEIPESDKSNNSASKNITIQHPPSIKPIRDIVLDEDTTMTNATMLVYYIQDPDTNWLDLNINVKSSNENCIATLNKYYGIDIQLGKDWNGKANITITVNDGGVSVNTSFFIIVNPVNDAPRFQDLNFSIYATEDKESNYKIKAYDPENDDITFSEDTELFEINSGTGEIIFTPSQEHVDNSPYKFNITLSDGILETKHEFELHIINIPDPPHISLVEEKVAKVGELFELQIIVYDEDSSEFYYYSKPSFVNIDVETGKISFKPNESQVGSHSIKIIVNDESLNSDSINFNLTIKSNTTNGHPNNSNGENGDDKNKVTKDDNDKGSELYLYLAIILILIIIIVVALLLIKQRKKPEKSDKYFSDEYLQEKQSMPGQNGKTGIVKKPQNYDEEYRKLYETPPSARKPDKVNLIETGLETHEEYKSKPKKPSKTKGKTKSMTKSKTKGKSKSGKKIEDSDDFEVEWQ